MFCRLMNIILCLFFFTSLCGQNGEVDSLRNLLEKEKVDTMKATILSYIGEALIQKGDFAGAINFGSQTLRLSESIKYSKGMRRGLAIIGNTYKYQGRNIQALNCYFKALDLAEKAHDQKSTANWLGNIGLAYNDLGNYEKGHNYLLRAYEVDQALGNKKGMARHLANMGMTLTQQGDYVKALEVNLLAVRINEEIDDKKQLSRCLGNIGLIYSYRSDFDKAIEYYEKAQRIFEEFGDIPALATLYGSLGNIYTELHQTNKALEFHFKALKLDSTLDNIYGIAKHLTNIGAVYGVIGDSLKEKRTLVGNLDSYNQLVYYHTLALKINDDIGNVSGKIINLAGLGSAFINLGKIDEGEKKLKDALKISLEQKDKKTCGSIYKFLSELYETKQDAKEAFDNFKLHIIYRDSLMNEENTKKIVQTQMNYEFEKKETQVKAAQEKKDALADEEKKKQEIIRNSFIAGFVFIALLALLIFRGYRSKQKANLIITRQKEEVEESKATIEHQKYLVEEKQKEILDSITYARRIQRALITNEKYIEKTLKKFR
jgi:tetratricopeptide (TPR) repeat protein